MVMGYDESPRYKVSKSEGACGWGMGGCQEYLGRCWSIKTGGRAPSSQRCRRRKRMSAIRLHIHGFLPAPCLLASSESEQLARAQQQHLLPRRLRFNTLLRQRRRCQLIQPFLYLAAAEYGERVYFRQPVGKMHDTGNKRCDNTPPAHPL